MSVLNNSSVLLLAADAGAAGGYQISRSLRFNSSDSAYLSRTPASAGNRKTWTWAGWVKRSKLGVNTGLFIVSTWPSPAEFFEVRFQTSDTLDFGTYSGGSYAGRKITSARYRDTSSWYHIVATFDSTNATASDRMRLYVNGERVTAFGTSTDPALNTESLVNSTVSHTIARFDASTEYVDGYLADIHFIDGQALDPSSFGEFDTNGVWQPIAYAGSYGTNGFHLPFSDNSTAAALGTDTSGNGNTWTVNNLSVTAGAGNDSLVDSPTNYGTDSGAGGGEVRGNYCTWNPLQSSAATLANGNLDCTTAVGTGAQTRGTIAVSTGKWYWEVLVNTTVTANNIGIIKTSEALAADRPGYFAGGYAYVGFSGNKENNASASSYGATYGSGDVIGVALDLDAGTLVFYKNGASQGTAFSSLSGEFIPAIGDGTGSSGMDISANFGQRPFAYTAPSGFKALCTTNLPEPTIADGSTVMDVALYTGNGSTQTISGLNFSPDFVWIKCRNSSVPSHCLFDTIRGATKGLHSNETVAEWTAASTLTAFNSDSFSLGSDGFVNDGTRTYVAWTWDAGSSTVTNTQGSITSQVRANASAGFSVVTYTGAGSAATVGHGLGVAPSMVIVKNRDFSSGTNWQVYHASIGNTSSINLNTTGTPNSDVGWWNNTSPTSTVYSVGTYNAGSPDNFVAYCFAPVAGYSSFGSYTGNGSADGPFVYTGFRPRWVMVKRSDSTASWQIYDTARGAYNVVTQTLAANESTAESGFTSGYDIDLLSNGFKPRTGPSNAINTSGGTYIYAAFAESPFQYARAR